MYTPVNPMFFYIKVGCKGVFISQRCFHDEACASAKPIAFTVSMKKTKVLDSHYGHSKDFDRRLSGFQADLSLCMVQSPNVWICWAVAQLIFPGLN